MKVAERGLVESKDNVRLSARGKTSLDAFAQREVFVFHHVEHQIQIALPELAGVAVVLCV